MKALYFKPWYNAGKWTIHSTGKTISKKAIAEARKVSINGTYTVQSV